MKIGPMCAAIALLAAFVLAPPSQASELSPAEVRAIAKEAYIYANPIVDNYRIQYDYFVNEQSPEYKTAWNLWVPKIGVN